MLTFLTILAIIAMGFCALIIFTALFTGTWYKFREAAARRSSQSQV